MLMEADLPNDVEALRALVLEQARELDVLKVFQAEIERLKAIIGGAAPRRAPKRAASSWMTCTSTSRHDFVRLRSFWGYCCRPAVNAQDGVMTAPVK